MPTHWPRLTPYFALRRAMHYKSLKFSKTFNYVVRGRSVFSWSTEYLPGQSPPLYHGIYPYSYCPVGACSDKSSPCQPPPCALYLNLTSEASLISVCRKHRKFISDTHMERRFWGCLYSELPFLEYYTTPMHHTNTDPIPGL